MEPQKPKYNIGGKMSVDTIKKIWRKLFPPKKEKRNKYGYPIK